MVKRLQETEQTISELRTTLSETRGGEPSPPSLPGRSTCPHTPSAKTGFDDASYAEANLSLDENGKLCYYGITSAVHAPSLAESTNIIDSHSSGSDARSLLTSNTIETGTWEEFALGNAAIQTDIPRDVISRLQIYWAWAAPMFIWVYVQRDMAISGPCYSPFLLVVMRAHAAHFDDHQTSELLISKARLLLGT
ncbi:hypothetical protein BBP40_006483 [Aspergillus hancockii]|nr:hypothetical protein BBP40_006483 [Aspergillus hancockii]